MINRINKKEKLRDGAYEVLRDAVVFHQKHRSLQLVVCAWNVILDFQHHS